MKTIPVKLSSFVVHLYLIIEFCFSEVAVPPPLIAPLDPSEPRARVAFLLTLNGRAVRQVRRLLRVLYHSDHFFYIHVDAVS